MHHVFTFRLVCLSDLTVDETSNFISLYFGPDQVSVCKVRFFVFSQSACEGLSYYLSHQHCIVSPDPVPIAFITENDNIFYYMQP